MTTADPKSVLSRLAKYHAHHEDRDPDDIGVEIHCECSCRCTYPLRRPGEIRAGVCSECGDNNCKAAGAAEGEK